MKISNHKQNGFTMIELLVVIVILGILGTIGFANFRGYFSRAINAERKASVNTVATIVRNSMASNGTDNRYVYADGDAVQAVLEADDYTLPAVKGGMCVWYGYTQGATSSSSDNGFIVLSLIDAEEDTNGNTIYGAVNGVSGFLDEAQANIANATLFNETTVGCDAETANLQAAIGDTDGDYTWINVSEPTNTP